MTRPRPESRAALVEVFDREAVAGWVDVPPGASLPEVALYADQLRVAVTRPDERIERHVAGEARAFRLPLIDIWQFVGPANRLTVRVAAQPAPIAGHGTAYVPAEAGSQSLAALAARLAAGEEFSRAGVLQLPKALDAAWQQAVLTLYDRLRHTLRDATGHDPFLVYGTLLGAVREGGFIGSDFGFDAAFVSRHRDAAAAARELRSIAFALIDAGYPVQATPTCLQITEPGSPGVRVDLFHLYFGEDGQLRFPFGIAGPGTITEATWTGVREMAFAGTAVLVPAAAEDVLAHIYGPDWRTPNPTFRWSRDRVGQASDAHLPVAMVEEIYWAGFYARTAFTSGSTFFEAVNSRSDLPETVVDIGCGDGRDAYAFAAAGRAKVTGLDRSHVGVRQATRKAAELGYGDRLRFVACDVGDAARLRATLLAARDGEAPITFYARFFLHSITEDVQRTLMSVVAEVARPGDHFAAEFRTDRDEAAAKVHGNHYRRFQNGAAFGRALRDAYGFVPLLEQEGNGFSPYQGEDPYLYRVVAVRP